MDWARILAYITGTVDQELLLRNEYLAACSGKFSALAEYAVKEQYPKQVIDNFEGNSRGAKLASAALIQAARNEGKILQDYFEYIDSIAYPHKNQLELSIIDPSVPFEEVLTVEMARCTELNPMQAAIINQLRKDHYLGGQ